MTFKRMFEILVCMLSATANADVDHLSTQNRLLDTAECLFALHGFAKTSVRQITAFANCNIAAVNYHFTSKKRLYEQVFDQRLQVLREYRLNAIQQTMHATRETISLDHLLASFARAFFAPLIESDQGRFFIRLFMREMIDPQLPPDTFKRQVIEPVRGALIEALLRVCPKLDEAEAMLCVHSTVAQLIHVIQANLIIGTDDREPAFDLDRTIDHIVRFSVAGIRQCEQGRSMGASHE